MIDILERYTCLVHIKIPLPKRYIIGKQQTMMTSSNENISRVTGHLCGEFTGHRWIPCIKASDTGLLFFFVLRLNKLLSKQSWGWWFETSSRALWRHCDVFRASKHTCNALVNFHVLNMIAKSGTLLQNQSLNYTVNLDNIWKRYQSARETYAPLYNE